MFSFYSNISEIKSVQKIEITSEQHAATIVFTFWLREIVDDPTVSYAHLMDVMLRYYWTEFAWDENRKHEELVLSHDNKRFVKMGGSMSGWNMWTSLCASNVLSAEKYSIVRWELTCMEKKSPLRVHIGFIDGEYIQNFSDSECIGDKAHEVSLEVVDGRYPRIWENSNSTNIHENWRFRSQKNDRLRLEFDFKKQECAAFYNDQCIGLLSKNLPSTCYLAASSYHQYTTLETTLFEAK